MLKLAKSTFKAPTTKVEEQIAKSFVDKDAFYHHVPITALKSLNNEEHRLKHVLCKPKLYFSERVGLTLPTVLGVGLV